MKSSSNLLSVKNLNTAFKVEGKDVTVVNNVSFDLNPGEIVGLVGESGCGKSVSALSIMGLVPDPPGKITGGEILLEGKDLLKLSEPEMEKVRGKEIGMIFQEPMTSLNPVLTIGKQITEILELHQGMEEEEAIGEAIELLKLVGLPDPELRIKDHPHQLSGGQRQRVMIAIALSCKPKILIADEPTTALDVTIQAQILELIQDLAKTLGTSVVLITHNLGILARYANKINVMYAGHLIESGNTDEIFYNPKHPYTSGLLNSVPRLDLDPNTELPTIPGEVPNLAEFGGGCVFRTRCPSPSKECKEGKSEMGLIEVKPGHWVDKCCVNCK
ncbi:MAG: peptide ABC transporter ATP-binding protein [Dehalococcoidia bacterium]|nr:peptide ABC transporter ATP-binding protein [Dehalococcoidia bacterium]MEC7920836.1 ABC transporter ATP-binding protein [Chloroflexota bacterium]|tara:strand:+ start:3296 stop:4285 length:990 start_codon:yes stop_codon:yes gene_type:complete